MEENTLSYTQQRLLLVQTAQLIIIMEEAAQLTLDARTIGGAHPFPPGALEQERRHMQQYRSRAVYITLEPFHQGQEADSHNE